ncbi:MAG: VWA domain-containing protein [Acidobacteriia bacterium]|nr:VWA domain-containing protein [Terriglobia bacterium]
MPKAGVVSLLFLAAAALIPGLAQDVTPPPVEPTIRVTATEVALDLVVRDRKGRQVKNVKPGDVEIYEDGVRQQLLSFRIVPGRVQARGEESQPKQQTTPTFLPLRELNTVCIVFHNIDPVTRPHAVEIVKEFIKSNLPPESYIGIFNLNEKLIAVHEFTKNRKELLASALNGRALDFSRASEALLTASPNIVTLNAQVNAATHTATVTEDTTGGELSNMLIVGADVSNSTGANRVRGDQVQERSDFAHITGMHETDRIATLINQIGTLPGRKTVLLVTTGLVTTGDPDLFQKILTNANNHGITFYALDSTEMNGMYDTAEAGKLALGQMASVSQQQSKTNASASIMRQNSRAGDDTISAVRTSDTQSSLRALSEGTGGFLIANTNDFRKPFQQLAADLDTHYEAVYRSTSPRFDGRLRKIEVKLARNDLQVESRTGYFAMPDLKGSAPLTRQEATAMAVLATEPRPHSFDFHLTAYHFRKDDANENAALAFELPGAKLGATADPARKIHKFEICLLALVRNANGEVVDKYSLDKPYYIADANLAAVRADQLTYTHVLDLPPGRYTVDAAVVDHEGAQATTETGSFEIPAPLKGLAISSLAMVEHLDPAGAQADTADPFTFQGKHVVPMVQAAVSPATKRWVYFVVYRDKSNPEKPKIHVEFKNGGEVFAEQTVALPEPDSNGAIAMFVAAATRPGNCELRITAMQGGQSATEQIAYLGAAQ